MKPEDSRSTASTEPKPDQTAGAAPPTEQPAEQTETSNEDKQTVEGVTQSETGWFYGISLHVAIAVSYLCDLKLAKICRG